MRLSSFPLFTLKETPAEAEVASHRLMLRAGLVRRLTAGIYTWMPLGLQVLRKVERVVREEMDRAGAHELLMPAVQPAELWQETGRWDEYGPLLLRIQDRQQREFCFGPTHEEVITDLVRREIKSYRQLPVNFYQIQTKFRDEIRPRFGVMRAREFLMKDAYSFHLDEASLQQGYDAMRAAYTRIFSRLGLAFRVVAADSGEIGGKVSEEFHVLADSGEDVIAWCENDGYAANVELAQAQPPAAPRPQPGEPMRSVPTPGVRSIEELSTTLGVAPAQCLKTLLVQGVDGRPVALVLRGDHELNAVKAAKLPEVADPLTMCDPQTIRAAIGADPGSIGPLGLDIPVIADAGALAVADFVCGANEPDTHLTGCNWGRDADEPPSGDLRNVVPGDPSPLGGGPLQLARGIEVGHIFQLGRRYSEAMQATVLDADGREQLMTMGCYGIGVSRVVAAAIEQHHDEQGISWPAAMAPFDVAIVPLNQERSPAVHETAERLYRELTEAGLEVLLDDRSARPGVKFADAELIGIPQRLVIGDKGLAEGQVEVHRRRDRSSDKVAVDAAAAEILRRQRDDSA